MWNVPNSYLCYEKTKVRVMGDEKHTILHVPIFPTLRKTLLDQIEFICQNFRDLGGNDEVFYILTCENESIIRVSRFLNIIFSSQRPSFSKVWKVFHGSGRWECNLSVWYLGNGLFVNFSTRPDVLDWFTMGEMFPEKPEGRIDIIFWFHIINVHWI